MKCDVLNKFVFIIISTANWKSFKNKISLKRKLIASRKHQNYKSEERAKINVSTINASKLLHFWSL